jgi:hypothetical protein
MKSKFVLIAPLVAALLLAACGGGGGGDDNGPVGEGESVPSSALESPESFSRWVGARPASEDKEPLLMMGVLPPTSDVAEPIDIN